MKLLLFLTVLLQHSIIFSNSIELLRIVGGEPAQRIVPYQISIRSRTRHICSGSIISEKHILTAAHCLRRKTHGKRRGDFKPITVRVGIRDINDTGLEYQVASHVIHPQYNAVEAINDIAVIELEGSVQANTNASIIDIIALRKEDAHDGEALTVRGWGRTGISMGAAETLQVLEVRAIANEECKQKWQTLRAFPVKQSNLCVMPENGQGACKGDSGGPLVDAQGRLVGVVSWVKPCALGMPDVYASVAYFYDWIMIQIKT